jgi:hypothetical protein
MRADWPLNHRWTSTTAGIIPTSTTTYANADLTSAPGVRRLRDSFPDCSGHASIAECYRLVRVVLDMPQRFRQSGKLTVAQGMNAGTGPSGKASGMSISRRILIAKNAGLWLRK